MAERLTPLLPDPRSSVERLLALGPDGTFVDGGPGTVGHVIVLMRQAIIEHEHRLARIEAVLIERRMHEPGCPVRDAQRANELGGWFALAQGPCDCWLAPSDEGPE